MAAKVLKLEFRVCDTITRRRAAASAASAAASAASAAGVFCVYVKASDLCGVTGFVAGSRITSPVCPTRQLERRLRREDPGRTGPTCPRRQAASSFFAPRWSGEKPLPLNEPSDHSDDGLLRSVCVFILSAIHKSFLGSGRFFHLPLSWTCLFLSKFPLLSQHCCRPGKLCFVGCKIQNKRV